MQSTSVQKAFSHWFCSEQYSPVGLNCLIYIVFVYSSMQSGIFDFFFLLCLIFGGFSKFRTLSSTALKNLEVKSM